MLVILVVPSLDWLKQGSLSSHLLTLKASCPLLTSEGNTGEKIHIEQEASEQKSPALI